MANLKELIEAAKVGEKASGVSDAQKELLRTIDAPARRAALEVFTALESRNAGKELLEQIDRGNQNIVDEHRKVFEAIAQAPAIYGFQQVIRENEDALRGMYLNTFREIQENNAQHWKNMVGETFSNISKNIVGEAIKVQFEGLRTSLLNPFAGYSGVMQDYEQAIRAATLSSADLFSKTLGEHIKLQNEDLFRQFSSSLLGYNHFAKSTLKQLRLAANTHVASALRGSLTLAREQVLRSTISFESFAERLVKQESEKLYLPKVQFPRVNRNRVQKNELLRRDDVGSDEDYNGLVEKAPSAISFDLIQNCLTLIGYCNETAETTRGKTIFSWTSAVWLAGCKLRNIVPTTRDNFATIVDCLYIMLYEGAGKDKLRFIEEGYISLDEAEIIWKIKHLRNKWLRHDVDHGKESDIKKSFQARKEAFEWFGLTRFPNSKDEFIFLYNNLLLKIEEFLNLLLDRVSKLAE